MAKINVGSLITGTQCEGGSRGWRCSSRVMVCVADSSGLVSVCTSCGKRRFIMDHPEGMNWKEVMNDLLGEQVKTGQCDGGSRGWRCQSRQAIIVKQENTILLRCVSCGHQVELSSL